MSNNTRDVAKVKVTLPVVTVGNSSSETTSGIEDVLVNGVSVVTNKKAYVIVPQKAQYESLVAKDTSLQQQINDSATEINNLQDSLTTTEGRVATLESSYVETYSKDYLDSKFEAISSDMVHKSIDEEISSLKTFKKGLVVGNDNTTTTISSNHIILGSLNSVNSSKTSVMGDNNLLNSFGGKAIGEGNTLGGSASIALGNTNRATNNNTMAVGNNLIVGTARQLALGNFNNPIEASVIIADGTSNTERNNALVIKDNNLYINGIGGYEGNTIDSDTLSLKEYFLAFYDSLYPVGIEVITNKVPATPMGVSATWVFESKEGLPSGMLCYKRTL